MHHEAVGGVVVDEGGEHSHHHGQLVQPPQPLLALLPAHIAEQGLGRLLHLERVVALVHAKLVEGTDLLVDHG